jgi:hypothetical protein
MCDMEASAVLADVLRRVLDGEETGRSLAASVRAAIERTAPLVRPKEWACLGDWRVGSVAPERPYGVDQHKSSG